MSETSTAVQSENITNEKTFNFTLALDENNEIAGASEISRRCSQCGADAIGDPGEVAFCEDHEDAIIDTTITQVELIDTPKDIDYDNNKIDLVFFTQESRSYANSFGVQVIDDDQSLVSICDLDGEALGHSGGLVWIVTDKVPEVIAEYFKAVWEV